MTNRTKILTAAAVLSIAATVVSVLKDRKDIEGFQDLAEELAETLADPTEIA